MHSNNLTFLIWGNTLIYTLPILDTRLPHTVSSVSEQLPVITHFSPICLTVGVLTPTLPACTATL